MSKFDVYLPIADADHQQYVLSVYAESQEEAEELAMKALVALELGDINCIL